MVGVFFTEESSYTSIMHRDQTDEWRGWMMMVTVPVLLLVPGRVAGHYHRLGVLSVHLRAECPGSRPEVGVRA